MLLRKLELLLSLRKFKEYEVRTVKDESEYFATYRKAKKRYDEEEVASMLGWNKKKYRFDKLDFYSRLYEKGDLSNAKREYRLRQQGAWIEPEK